MNSEKIKSNDWTLVTNKRYKKNKENNKPLPSSNEKITIKCNGQIRTY